MTNMLRTRRWRGESQGSCSEVPRPKTTTRDRELRRKRQEYRDMEVDPSNPRSKRPMGEKKKSKKKKKSTPVVGTLLMVFGIRIPVPLTKKEERMQLIETLQRNTVERTALPVPYHEGFGSSRLELQKKALEEIARRKAAMDAMKARGEGTSSQRGGSSSK